MSCSGRGEPNVLFPVKTKLTLIHCLTDVEKRETQRTGRPNFGCFTTCCRGGQQRSALHAGYLMRTAEFHQRSLKLLQTLYHIYIILNSAGQTEICHVSCFSSPVFSCDGSQDSCLSVPVNFQSTVCCGWCCVWR